MRHLTISLFGKLQVRGDAQALPGFDRRKTQELFCYLLLFRDRPHPREILADLFWSDTSQPRLHLRKALWQIQAALNAPAEADGDGLFWVEPAWIQLNPQAALSLDVVQLENIYLQVQGLPGSRLDPHLAHLLHSIVDLYRGDLLEDCYTDWCLVERERYRHMYLAMLDKLMAFCEAQHQFEAGVGYGRLALRWDLARERTHRRLMRLLYLNGDRTEALRQYAHCAQTLKEELGVEPTARTKTLYHQISAEAVVAGQLPRLDPASFTSLVEILAQIQEAQTLLAQAQSRLEQEFEKLT